MSHHSSLGRQFPDCTKTGALHRWHFSGLYRDSTGSELRCLTCLDCGKGFTQQRTKGNWGAWGELHPMRNSSPKDVPVLGQVTGAKTEGAKGAVPPSQEQQPAEKEREKETMSLNNLLNHVLRSAKDNHVKHAYYRKTPSVTAISTALRRWPDPDDTALRLWQHFEACAEQYMHHRESRPVTVRWNPLAGSYQPIEQVDSVATHYANRLQYAEQRLALYHEWLCGGEGELCKEWYGAKEVESLALSLRSERRSLDFDRAVVAEHMRAARVVSKADSPPKASSEAASVAQASKPSKPDLLGLVQDILRTPPAPAPAPVRKLFEQTVTQFRTASEMAIFAPRPVREPETWDLVSTVQVPDGAHHVVFFFWQREKLPEPKIDPAPTPAPAPAPVQEFKKKEDAAAVTYVDLSKLSLNLPDGGGWELTGYDRDKTPIKFDHKDIVQGYLDDRDSKVYWLETKTTTYRLVSRTGEPMTLLAHALQYHGVPNHQPPKPSTENAKESSTPVRENKGFVNLRRASVLYPPGRGWFVGATATNGQTVTIEPGSIVRGDIDFFHSDVYWLWTHGLTYRLAGENAAEIKKFADDLRLHGVPTQPATPYTPGVEDAKEIKPSTTDADTDKTVRLRRFT